jgi:hypothetical protein
MAQSLKIFVPYKRRGRSCVSKQVLRCPPCFLQNSTGSNIFAAVDTAIPALNLQALMEYAMSGVGFVILTITADLASSGGRMKCEIGRRIVTHNEEVLVNSLRLGGVILLIDSQCGAHILHREIEVFCGLDRASFNLLTVVEVRHVTVV